MGKKISIFLFSILLLSFFTITASAKVGLELRGGLAMMNPEQYNVTSLYPEGSLNRYHGFTDAIANLYGDAAFNSAQGYNSITNTVDGSLLSQMFDGTAILSIFIGDSFAIKLRGDALNSENDDIVTIDGEEVIYSHTALMMAYAGAGLSYYLNFSPNFSFYLSADGGMFLNLQSFYEIGSFSDASPTLNTLNIAQGSYSYDFKESFFGGHGEAGIQLLFNEGLGISLFGGYRYGIMPLVWPNGGAVNLTDANGNKAFTADKPNVLMSTEIDISGVYLGGGLNFYFGAEKLGGSDAAKVAPAGGVSKYEQYGNAFFKKKDYKSALAYYNGAYKLAPNARLLKQMGFCYYYMKNKAKALEYLQKYLQANPNDEAIKKWVAPLLMQ